MAQIREIRLIDDLTGDAADETIEFGLDGKRYEIDLATDNASKLRDALVLQRHLDVRLVVADRGGGSDRRGLGVVVGVASATSAASR